MYLHVCTQVLKCRLKKDNLIFTSHLFWVDDTGVGVFKQVCTNMTVQANLICPACICSRVCDLVFPAGKEKERKQGLLTPPHLSRHPTPGFTSGAWLLLLKGAVCFTFLIRFQPLWFLSGVFTPILAKQNGDPANSAATDLETIRVIWGVTLRMCHSFVFVFFLKLAVAAVTCYDWLSVNRLFAQDGQWDENKEGEMNLKWNEGEWDEWLRTLRLTRDNKVYLINTRHKMEKERTVQEGLFKICSAGTGEVRVQGIEGWLGGNLLRNVSSLFHEENTWHVPRIQSKHWT